MRLKTYLVASLIAISTLFAKATEVKYSYDELGRLSSVTYIGKEKADEFYSYDERGNLAEKRIGEVVWTYEYDRANQVASMKTPEGTRTYKYDNAGRLLEEHLDGKLDASYKYGYLDKVIEINRNGAVTKFNYDGMGMLVEKILPDGKSEKWVWDGIALVARGDDVYVNEAHISGGTPILTKTDKGVRYHTSDFLGTTLWSSDTQGNIIDSYADTSVFGEGSVQNDRAARFTGKPYDADLQAFVFPYRNYKPDLARWTSSDPAGFPDGINNHYYACVPTIDIDFLGLATLEIYGRPVAGAPLGTHTYGVVTVNSSEYSQLASSQQSNFNSNSDGTYSSSVGGYKSDGMVGNPNSPAGMGNYIDLTYNNPADAGGTKGGNVTNANGSSNLDMNFVNAFLNAANNFNSNETSSLYSAIPITSEFGNCNSLLSQLIEIAGGDFDSSTLPWDAIGWSHRMNNNLFEK